MSKDDKTWRQILRINSRKENELIEKMKNTVKTQNFMEKQQQTNFFSENLVGESNRQIKSFNNSQEGSPNTSPIRQKTQIVSKIGQYDNLANPINIKTMEMDHRVLTSQPSTTRNFTKINQMISPNSPLSGDKHNRHSFNVKNLEKIM